MPRTIVYPFAVTIPAGTPIAAPLVTLTQFEANEIERIEWRFPGGCNGVVGIQVGARSVPVIPANRSQFIIRTGDSHGYDLSGMHNTGDWSVIGYNTGAFAHTVTVYFYAHRIEVEPPIPFYLKADPVESLRGGYQ